MAKFQNEVQKFRHRGFESNDGSPVEMIFGDGPVPVNADGSAKTVLWDHDVEQAISVKDHVDPVAVAPAPAEAPAPDAAPQA